MKLTRFLFLPVAPLSHPYYSGCAVRVINRPENPKNLTVTNAAYSCSPLIDRPRPLKYRGCFFAISNVETVETTPAINKE